MRDFRMKTVFMLGTQQATENHGFCTQSTVFYPQLLWVTLGITLFIKSPDRASTGFAGDAHVLITKTGATAKIRLLPKNHKESA